MKHLNDSGIVETERSSQSAEFLYRFIAGSVENRVTKPHMNYAKNNNIEQTNRRKNNNNKSSSLCEQMNK